MTTTIIRTVPETDTLVQSGRGKGKLVIDRTHRLVKDTLDLIVLDILNGGEEKSGSDIMKELKRRSGLKVGPSTIYPLLYSMEEEELVTGQWVATRRRMRLYKITEMGHLYRDMIFKSLVGIFKAIFEDFLT